MCVRELSKKTSQSNIHRDQIRKCLYAYGCCAREHDGAMCVRELSKNNESE